MKVRSSNSSNRFKCESCGKWLANGPFDHPERRNDKFYCDECYDELFRFVCCRCECTGDIELQHYYLVVMEPVAGSDGRDVQPGIYYITESPYFGGPIIGEMELFVENLQALRDCPEDIVGDVETYPCGHLCSTCVNELKLYQPVKYTLARKNVRGKYGNS